MVDQTCVFCTIDLSKYHDPRGWSAPCFEEGEYCEYCAWLPCGQGYSYYVGAENAHIYFLSKYNGNYMCMRCYYLYDEFIKITIGKSEKVMKQLMKQSNEIVKMRLHKMASHIELHGNLNQLVAAYALDILL